MITPLNMQLNNYCTIMDCMPLNNADGGVTNETTDNTLFKMDNMYLVIDKCTNRQ